MEDKSVYVDIGTAIGKLVSEKQRAYGDSFSKSCEILEILYPNGITPDRYRDLLTITRVIDKLFRIATKKDALGENAWEDIAGYSILSVWRDSENKGE